MDFGELDRLFDRTLERLDNPSDNLRSAYNKGPLAEDHELLRKAWDYFKGRLRTVDEQYRQLLEAKNTEISALKAQLEQAASDVARLEKIEAEVVDVEARVKAERARELRELEAATARVKEAWHLEREALERRVQDLEAVVENGRAAAKTLLEKTKADRIRLAADRDAARLETATAAEKHAKAQAEFSKALLEKDETIRLLENRVERLQAEIARRDQLLKEMDGRRALEQKRADGLEAAAAKQAEELREQSRELDLLKLKLEVVTKEKDAVRDAWLREQAQWRELWERGRDMWDKKRGSDSSSGKT